MEIIRNMSDTLITLTVQFYAGLTIGLSTGAVLGFIGARRNKDKANNVSALQLLALLAVFGYVGLSFAFARDPNVIISVAILATGYGVKGGEILEKILDRKK